MNPRTCLVSVCATLAAVVASGCVSNSRSHVAVGVGGGHYEVKTAGVGSGDARAGLLEVAWESVSGNDFGGGIRARGLVTDDDLDTDGPGPDLASFEVADGEWFFHGTYDGADGADRLPVRLGLSMRGLRVEDTSSDEEIVWNSFGPRAEFAPEWAFQRWDDDRISVFGLLGVGYGYTNIETSVAPNDFETNAVYLDMGFGVRATLNGLLVDVGYRYLSSHYAESEVANSLTVRETDTTFSGVVFSIGGRF